MRVQLLCENVGFDDIQFEVTPYSLMMGRSVKADVRIGHPLVSRLHCEWKLVDGDVVLRDLEATNHTLVNGEPIQQAVLQSGDRVLLGNVLYIVEILEDQPNGMDDRPMAKSEGADIATPRFGLENASWQTEEI